MKPTPFRHHQFAALALVLAWFSLVPISSWASTRIPNAAQPQLALGSDGRVWLVYGQSAATPPVQAANQQQSGEHGPGQHKNGGHQAPDRSGELFVAQSSDGEATFGPAMKVGFVPKLMLGMRRGPRIAAHGDRITVTVIGQELQAFTSIDSGKNWSGPIAINDVPTSAREGLHDLTAAPDGKLFVTWLDLRNGKMELWGAESNDGGKTWGSNEQVYRSPDKSICECCHPNVLFDAEGNLAVMWRNSIEGSRDMWLARRPKGAKQFTPAKKLGEGTWKLNGCPMDGGEIVALGGGNFGAVFQRAGDIFFAPPDGAEILLGKGRQPIATKDGADTVALWQEGTDLIVARKLGDGQPVKFASDARFPALVALPGSGGLVLAYEQGPAKEKQPGIVIERL